MGIFNRRRATVPPAEVEAPTRSVESETPPDWRDAIRRYRDPLHPERLPHPKKVARTLYASKTVSLDAASVTREAEVAGVDPAAVFAELDALRAREEHDARASETTAAIEQTGWREATVVRHFDSQRLFDLRPFGGTTWKVVGMGFWLDDGERESLRPGAFVLRREPENPYDANAIAVYLDSRKIGYLSTAKAAAFAPVLERLPFDGYKVNAEIERRNVRVVLPQPSVLRKSAGP